MRILTLLSPCAGVHYQKWEKPCRGKFPSSPFREELSPRGSNDTVSLPSTPRQSWCTDEHWDKLSSLLTQGWCWRQVKQWALSSAPEASHSYTRTRQLPVPNSIQSTSAFMLLRCPEPPQEVPWTMRNLPEALPQKMSFLGTAYSHSVLYHRYTQRKIKIQFLKMLCVWVLQDELSGYPVSFFMGL